MAIAGAGSNMSRYWITLLIGLAGGALPVWWLTADHYQGIIAKEHEAQQALVIKQQEQNRLALLAYADRIVKAGADHDKNANIVRTLRNSLDRLRYLEIPICPLPGTAEVGADSDGGAGLLYEKTNRAFRTLQEGDDADFERCDTLNINAIRANAAR